MNADFCWIITITANPMPPATALTTKTRSVKRRLAVPLSLGPGSRRGSEMRRAKATGTAASTASTTNPYRHPTVEVTMPPIT